MQRRLVLPFLLLSVAADAATYSVGASRTYTSPCTLAANVTLGPGDLIEVDPGTYTDACQLVASGTAVAPITVRGLAGTPPLFDATGVDLSGAGSVPRAIFQFTGGSFWVVEHLELENASNSSANGAAFRVTGGAHDILIQDVSVHDCQDGMMSDGIATVTVQASDIFHNGAGDGFSHNFYMQGDSTTLIGNHIHDSNGGQNVKLRSRYAAVLFNLIENAGDYEMDLIQGPLTSEANANAVLIGNVIVRPPTSGNDSQVILFGTDDATQLARNGSLYAVNNTIILQNSANRLFHAVQPVSGSEILLENNIIFATVAGTALVSDATTGGILLGDHNWVASNVAPAASLTQTQSGVDPGFVSSTDYHLGPSSPSIGQGTFDAGYLDGTGATQSAVPTQEFSLPDGTAPRLNAGGLDLGAFAYASSADGGVVPDGGLDAGQPATDGGTPASLGTVPEPSAVSGSCACSEAPGSSLLGSLLVVAAFLRRRQARSQLESRPPSGKRKRTPWRQARQASSAGTSQPAART
jgi:hypothetical protein